MKKIIVFLLCCLAVSCGNKDSLQKYFVESSEKPNFTQIDISPKSMVDEKTIKTDKEKQLLGVVDKINILFYQKEDEASFNSEIERVNHILEADQYDELIRFNSDMGRGKVKVTGHSTEVNELVIELSNSSQGFVLARVLGNNMTPENLFQLGLLMKDSQVLQQKVVDFLSTKK